MTPCVNKLVKQTRGKFERSRKEKYVKNHPRSKTLTVITPIGEIKLRERKAEWCKLHGLRKDTLVKTFQTGKFYKGFRVIDIQN